MFLNVFNSNAYPCNILVFDLMLKFFTTFATLSHQRITPLLNPLSVTRGGGVKLPQGDLSTAVPVQVEMFMNTFVTFPKYVFFTK